MPSGALRYLPEMPQSLSMWCAIRVRPASTCSRSSAVARGPPKKVGPPGLGKRATQRRRVLRDRKAKLQLVPRKRVPGWLTMQDFLSIVASLQKTDIDTTYSCKGGAIIGYRVFCQRPFLPMVQASTRLLCICDAARLCPSAIPVGSSVSLVPLSEVLKACRISVSNDGWTTVQRINEVLRHRGRCCTADECRFAILQLQSKRWIKWHEASGKITMVPAKR